MSLAEADKLAPAIQLESIIESLAPADFETEKVIVVSPQYMKDLVGTLNETPKEVIQMYFVWKTIQEFASYIEADAVKPYKRFRNELQGKVRPKLPIHLILADLPIGSRIYPREMANMRRARRQWLGLDLESVLRRESIFCCCQRFW